MFLWIVFEFMENYKAFTFRYRLWCNMAVAKMHQNFRSKHMNLNFWATLLSPIAVFWIVFRLARVDFAAVENQNRTKMRSSISKLNLTFFSDFYKIDLVLPRFDFNWRIWNFLECFLSIANLTNYGEFCDILSHN